MNQSSESMTRAEAETLLGRVSAILEVVDREAQEVAWEQGWDNRIVLAMGLPVSEQHLARAGVTWVEPEGWEPEEVPAGADDLTYDAGALWGVESEEFGVATDSEVKNGLTESLFWLQSNTSNLPAAGDIGGEGHWRVRGSIDGTRFAFRPDMTDAEIRAELEDCYPCLEASAD